MVQQDLDLVGEVQRALTTKRCWYASCGGAAASSFELAFGEKIPRQEYIHNPQHSEEFNRFEGEANLLVWCTWRLDAPLGPVSSSDDSNQGIEQALNTLIEQHVAEVDVSLPSWDLKLVFSNGAKLLVFCDHVGRDPSFDGNWELWKPDKAICIGVSSAVEVESRNRTHVNEA